MTNYSELKGRDLYSSYINTTYIDGEVVDYANYEIACTGALETSGYIVNDIKFVKSGMPFTVSGLVNPTNNSDFFVQDITRKADNEFYIQSNSGVITETNDGTITINLFGATNFDGQIISANDAEPDDNFGYSVAIENNIIVIGAHREDTGGSETGAAYIFEKSGEAWIEIQKIQASDKEATDYFGHSVAINNDTIVVGAYGEDTGGSLAGATYIFEKSGEVWIETQKIQGSDIDGNDYFGYSVAIDNGIIIVGAWGKNSAYTFEYNGSSWVETQKISPGISIEFGRFVAINNDIIAIGAPGTAGSLAYVYKNINSSWIEQQQLQGHDTEVSDRFGEYITINNNEIIIASPQEDTGGSNAGAVYVFEKLGNTWIETQKIQGYDTEGSDYFGTAIAIENNIILVSSYGKDSVYIFEHNGANWIEKNKIIHSSHSNSLAINNGEAIVGEHYYNSLTGMAHVYNLKKHNISDNYPVKYNASISKWKYYEGDKPKAYIFRELSENTIFFNGSIPIQFNNLEAGEKHFSYEGVSKWLVGTQVTNDNFILQNKEIKNDSGTGIDEDGYIRLKGNNDLYPAGGGYNLGISFAYNGASLIIGHEDEGGAVQQGGASIFKYNGSNWKQTQFLTTDNTDSLEYFGNAMSIDNDVLIIGSYKETDAPTNSCGAVYIFRYNENISGGIWIKEQRLIASDKDSNERFGNSVAIKGNTAFVGASANGNGVVYKYTHSDGVWGNEQTLQANNVEDYNGGYGFRMALEDNILVVSSENDELNAGAAHIFIYNGNEWIEEQKLTPPDTGFLFGQSVSVYKDIIAVGATQGTNDAVITGSVYIFRYNGSSWALEQEIFASDGVDGDRFGNSVSVHEDKIIIGAYEVDYGGNSSVGAAYVFKYDGSTWLEKQKMLSVEKGTNDELGRDVFACNDFLMASATGEGTGENGRVYIYQVT